MTNYVGRTLGPYKLEAPLGKGGMAAVYRAYQASVKRYVAIKVMDPEVAEQAGFVERFEREAQMIASLEHPHILPVIDYGLADGLHYIVMRYIEGGSLDERMRRKPLSLQECARLLTQIASALDYAHRKGVVHRDLKPNNVLLDSDENSYLTDFGIARLTQSQTRLTATGSVMGTPAYMSPEQAMGRPVDGRSDIYTLGVMLYEMVLNKLPFAADTPAALIFQHVYEQPPAPRSIKPDISDSVALVLDRAMAKSPDARYQLAADLASAFAEAINYRSSTPQKSAPAVGSPSMDMEKTAPITTPGRAGTPVERENTLIDVDGSRRTPGSVAPGQAPWQPARQPEYAPPSMPAQQSGARRQSPAQSIPAIPVETPARQGLPLGLVVIGVVVILLVIGGGALAIISNSNSASATQAAVNTAQAVVAITQTNIAIALVQTNTRIAELSRTPTPTATPSVTPTSSPTPTSTPTPTVTATPTVDATGTFVAGILATNNSINATGTAQVERTQTQSAARTATRSVLEPTLTALAATATAFSGTRAVQLTQTREAVLERTSDAARMLTVTALFRTQSAATPGGPTLPSVDLQSALTSNDANVVITALVNAKIVPADYRPRKAVLARRSVRLTGRPESERVFLVDDISSEDVTNFVLSLDMAITSTDGALDKTACGIFYNGAFDTQLLLQDAVVLMVYRDQFYGLLTRQDSTWAEKYTISAKSPLVQGGNGVNNRVTMVVVDGKITAFMNGIRLFQTTESTFDGGRIGYYMRKGVTGTGEQCNFAGTNLWELD